MPNMRRGVQGPRQMGGGFRGGVGGFASPSASPNKFANQVSGSLDRILGQMGSPGHGGQVGLPDFGPNHHLGNHPGNHKPHGTLWTEDPGVKPPVEPSQFGPESLNTVAPGIDPKQFRDPNFLKQGMRGSKGLDSGFGSMGSMMGMMGTGGSPFSSGGMMAGGQDFLSMFLPLLLSQMQGGQGPQVGR